MGTFGVGYLGWASMETTEPGKELRIGCLNDSGGLGLGVQVGYQGGGEELSMGTESSRPLYQGHRFSQQNL